MIRENYPVLENKLRVLKKTIFGILCEGHHTTHNLPTSAEEQLDYQLSDIVNFISTEYSDENYLYSLDQLMNTVITEELFRNPFFFNHSFRKLANLYAFHLGNDLYSTYAALFAKLDYFRKLSPASPLAWLLHPLLTFYLERGHFPYDKRELTFPVTQEIDFCELFLSLYQAIRKLFQDNNNLLYLYDSNLRENLLETLKIISHENQKISFLFEQGTLAAEGIALVSFLKKSWIKEKDLRCYFPGNLKEALSLWQTPSFRNILTRMGGTIPSMEELKRRFLSYSETTQPRGTLLYFCSGIAVSESVSFLNNKNGDYYFIPLKSIENQPPALDLLEENFILIRPDTPNQPKRVTGTDVYHHLLCLKKELPSDPMLSNDKDNEPVKLSDFFRSLRGIKEEKEIQHKLKQTLLIPPKKDTDQLILADIYYRAGYFRRSFRIIQEYYPAKIAVAYRICIGIQKHTNDKKLIQQIHSFLQETDLFQKAFCAELYDSIKDGTEDSKTRNEASYWL